VTGAYLDDDPDFAFGIAQKYPNALLPFPVLRLTRCVDTGPEQSTDSSAVRVKDAVSFGHLRSG
jgi:hypothetical protein